MDYGDGTVQNLGAITGTNIALHHVYQSGGTFTARLTATDSNGGVGASATSVFVQAATPLSVSLTSSQVSSGTNTTVTFTATVIGLGNAVVVNYHWVFGGPHPPADNSSNVQTRTYTAGSGPITVSVDNHDVGRTKRDWCNRDHTVGSLSKRLPIAARTEGPGSSPGPSRSGGFRSTNCRVSTADTGRSSTGRRPVRLRSPRSC